ATVFAREMWDLASGGQVILDDQSADPQCATPFLRHYFYDCDGKIKEGYDTETDGLTAYEAVQPMEAKGAAPSVELLEWPSKGFEQHSNHDFSMLVENPKSLAIGQVAVHSQTPHSTSICNQELVSINVRGTPRAKWYNQPNNNGKFTLTPDETVRQMSVFRLEFHDLDGFESVSGLSPWPDAIVDSSGGDPFVVEDDAAADGRATNDLTLPNNFFAYEEKGAIRANGPDKLIYAYYYNIPTEISYWYHNRGGGNACHSVGFTGYSLEPGPCCNGCEDDVDVGCETFVLKDQQEDGSESFFLRKICKERDGTVIVEDTQLDGTTPYTPEGNVLPPASGGDCSATVISKEMLDLSALSSPSFGSGEQEMVHCATNFLRHYVYDCDGKVKDVYDTGTDGVTPYQGGSEAVGAGGAVPSMTVIPWLPGAHTAAPE